MFLPLGVHLPLHTCMNKATLCKHRHSCLTSGLFNIASLTTKLLFNLFIIVPSKCRAQPLRLHVRTSRICNLENQFLSCTLRTLLCEWTCHPGHVHPKVLVVAHSFCSLNGLCSVHFSDHVLLPWLLSTIVLSMLPFIV